MPGAGDIGSRTQVAEPGHAARATGGQVPTIAEVVADLRARSRTRQEGLFRRMAGVRLAQLQRDRLSAALVAAERAAKRGDAQARDEADARLDALLEAGSERP